MLAVLCSRRFHPGHVSHLLASQEMLSYNGYTVLFRTNFQYENNFYIKGKNYEIKFIELFSLNSGDLFIVWFPSFRALFDVVFVGIFTRAKIIFIYHEPFDSISAYYKSGFKIIQIVKILISSFVNKLISHISDKVLLPSKKAFNALPKAREYPNKFAQLNLIFPDEVDNKKLLCIKSRTYISYIGTIAADHAFDIFLENVYQCVNNNLIIEFNFLIATKSMLPEYLHEKIKYCENSGRLSVQSGSSMSNIQINSCYEKSFLVWNAYRRSMQSGVLPKAYMFGAPVLISDKNQSEYFINGINGAMVSSNCDVVEFVDAVVFVKKNWTSMSFSCRENFLRNFYWLSQNIEFFKFIKD